MIRSKLGALGLCAVVLGAMAFGANVAQAEVGAKWLFLNSEGETKTGSELHAVLQAEAEGGFKAFLSKLLGINFEITCTAESLVGVKLESEGSLTNGGKIKFTGCSVKLNGVVAPECEVHSPGSSVGTVETSATKALLVLVSGSPLILFVPSEGETFVTLNMGEECPVGENVPVRGKVDLRDCENNLTTYRVKHLFEESPEATEIWILNNTAEHKATFKGSELFSLAGEHSGLVWAGDPA